MTERASRPGRARLFFSDEGGNVAMIFALSMFPVIGVGAMAVDYTLAGRREAQLNAIADAAALSTTAPAAMAQTWTVAQTNARAMFVAQAALVGGATVVAPTVTGGDTTAANGVVTRSATVSYTATSSNAFSSLLQMPTMPLGGSSSVSASTAPNIDFYLLLDTSPSMGIPATQAGIDAMIANTPKQNNGKGCAFACHESNPSAGDVAGNPNGIDNYTLAKQQLGLTLRIDLVQQATANLMTTAANTEAANKAVYRVATYTFDQSFKTITSLTSNLQQAQSDASSKIQMLQVYSENMLTANNNNNDEDTAFDSAMANSAYIPNPGHGSNASNDTPQEVLFIVTDGVIDEPYPNQGSQDNTSNGRTITTVSHQVDYCTPLKNRGVRIAILYTPYLPLPNNDFYMSYVAPVQNTIPTALTNCASPGLFFQVNTGGDINGAMQALFVKAVGSAHLTQ